ncbi:hypothetical protein HU200_040502 [Digitaria exilis]|uniref:Uncharacterized protein n=1 Tax=Digitaria exilis TaxID=1010633 RepID=A0A835B946_9POAL|nr:hypothetical protein HU200_040502 [Digitaria exilis]CAB3449181.1 unnamed protein product [Digitaria exilis]
MVSIKEMGRLDAERQPPAWFHPFLATSFFEPCPKHPATTSGRWTQGVKDHRLQLFLRRLCRRRPLLRFLPR